MPSKVPKDTTHFMFVLTQVKSHILWSVCASCKTNNNQTETSPAVILGLNQSKLLKIDWFTYFSTLINTECIPASCVLRGRLGHLGTMLPGAPPSSGGSSESSSREETREYLLLEEHQGGDQWQQRVEFKTGTPGHRCLEACCG